ncbi:ABC transporter permease, partial [Micromonospora zhanjiangensis]
GRTEADFAGRDRAVRDRFAAGLGGVPATTSVARYGTGRQLTGDLGSVPAGTDGVFAEMTSLADLPAYADLVDGAWATPGGSPLRVTLPEKVATMLKVAVGDRIPMRDRAARRDGEVEVTGIWRPRDVDEPYWRLAPGVGAVGGSTTSYGPFVLAGADFSRTFAGTGTSAAWLVTPDLSAADSSRLGPVRQAAADA